MGGPPFQLEGQPGGVFHGENGAIFTMPDQVFRPHAIAHDGWQAAIERLRHHEPEALLQRWEGTFRLRRKDGAEFTAFVKDAPMHDDAGNLIGIVGVSIELSDPDLGQALRAVANHDGHRPRARVLSPREREILGLLARGLTGEQIATNLVLSPETIRTHIRNAREKLGASTRVEAVTMALLAQEIQL